MIYLDNSATTYPKPASVVAATASANRNFSFNSGRGGYSASLKTSEKIFSVREKTAELVNAKPENIVFTHNCTLALNMAIKGSVKSGDHIIISSVEHNAVSRVVYTLKEYGDVTFSVAEFDYDSDKTLENFKRLIRNNTTLIVCTMASNVFGCKLPIKEIGELARKNNIRFVVDGAQGVGIFDTDIQRDNIDILCSAGHKGLYGPLSTGFMAIKDDVRMRTIVEGGTGSSSLMLKQPDFLPDRFEAGTLNNSGVIGMGAGIDFVNMKGIDKIYAHEKKIISFIYDTLSKNDNVTLYTPHPNECGCAPILAFNYKDYSSEKTASLLGEAGIAVRGGFHCAPLAHESFGTKDRGVVRISPSVFTSFFECEKFLNYLKKL